MTGLTPLASEDQAALKGLIEDYVTAWTKGERVSLKRFWDSTEAEPFYIAEEVDDFLIGWQAIEAYWQAGDEAMNELLVHTWDHRFKAVAEGLASGLFWLHWSANLPGPGRPIGGKVKAVVLCRKTAEGWRLIQWTESMLGPFPFLRKIYEDAAHPDLGKSR